MLVSAILSFLYLATDLFNSDKKSYIFENNTALTEALGKEAETGILSVVKSLKFVGITFSQQNADRSFLLESTKDLFKSESDLVDLAVFEFDVKTGAMNQIIHLVEYKHLNPLGLKEDDLIELEKIKPLSSERIFQNGVIIENIAVKEGFELTRVAVAFKAKSRQLFISTHMLQGQRFHMFQRSKVYTTFLINRYGQLLAHSDRKLLFLDDPFSGNETVKDILSGESLVGAREYEKEGGERYILAYRKIQELGLTVFSEIPSSKAYAASARLIEKSILFAMLILLVSFVFSIPFTRRLTAALRQLYLGTTKVSQGNFDINIPVKSNDEIGSLSSAFNKMTNEITRLIKETADKARMEKEIETAQLVQDNFIPEDYFEVGQLEIASYFRPASECGGDWWGYQRTDDSIIVMLGDATGHGVGPALITSAVYSCNATLTWLISQNIIGELSPAQIMSAFNTAVFQAGRGKIKMTFFIARIDIQTGDITYCNASHETPITCPAEPGNGESFKLTDLEPLVGQPGPCLGQHEVISFEEFTFKPDDNYKLVIYTDGITECLNKEDNEYGETRFFRSLFKSAQLDAKDVKNNIINQMLDFLGDRMTDDDITLVVINKKSQAGHQKKVG